MRPRLVALHAPVLFVTFTPSPIQPNWSGVFDLNASPISARAALCSVLLGPLPKLKNQNKDAYSPATVNVVHEFGKLLILSTGLNSTTYLSLPSEVNAVTVNIQLSPPA